MVGEAEAAAVAATVVGGDRPSERSVKRFFKRTLSSRIIMMVCNFTNQTRRNCSGARYGGSFRIVFASPAPKGRYSPSRQALADSRSHALQVQHRLKEHYIPEITSITYEGRLVDAPEPLPWFPDQLAWQMTTPKNVVRRFPPFASFKKFLVSETAVGNISRQEVVSMIPPLLLDVRPGMTVLDLCAAPGSKAAQLIEMVHGGEEARIRKVVRELRQREGREVSPEGDDTKLEMKEEEQRGDWADEGRSTGLLIANDVDSKRAHMLVHQMKRLNSPNLIVTSHDATMFPSIKLASTRDNKASPNRYLKFDRILADVPCSGDGTVRKNFKIWKEWSPVNGLGLHLTQVRILVRSLQMLKVGGRVVYSTCSMNPVENEAAVAAAIDRCGGRDKVDLLDCSAALPGLRRRSGLKTWNVLGKDGKRWLSWGDVLKQRETHGEDHLGKISATCFPSSTTDAIPLERCMRICAHYQDTGAFFIAVLEKKTEIRARPEENKTTKAAASAAPITAIVDELESKPNGTEVGEHIKAADALVPPILGDAQIDDSTPAMRQNENGLDDDSNERKRKVTNENVEPSNKRPALAYDSPPAASGDEERRVHFPPPPGANLDLTTHDDGYKAANTQNSSKRSQNFEEPFKYLDPDHEALHSIYKFYGLSKSFPRDRFLVRNASGIPAKKIYYTSALSKEILTENEGKGLKFIHAGITMFVKQDVQSEEVCRWRIQTDGLPLIEAGVTEERVMRLHSKEVFRKLLIEMFPKVSGNGWVDLGEIGKRALEISMGCCVLRIEKGDGDDAFRYAPLYEYNPPS